MRFFRKKAVWSTGLAGVGLIVAVTVVSMAARQPAEHLAAGVIPSVPEATDDEGGEGALAVKTIHPQCNPSFAFSVSEPATVKAYYFSPLDAQVAGQVEFIRKADGSPVKAGELLAKIAVPDLDQEVLLKEATVNQRQEELAVARKHVAIAEAAKTVALNNIEVEQAGVDAAKAWENYRGKLYRRLKRAFDDPRPFVTGEVVEEAELGHVATQIDVKKAASAVIKAQSALTEAQAKLDAANADVKLKNALVAVARQDKKKAEALATYSEIRSTYSGLVKRRHVDPGAFVRIGEPILTVERTDIVSVEMKVPDSFAPYVSEDTDAYIELAELPGLAIHGKVTRSVPSLESESKDRTRLVQVDLFNGTQQEYDAFIAREEAKKQPYHDFKEGPLPVPPKLMGTKSVGTALHLLPGTYCEMRLVFNKLPNVFLIPSDAIDRSGGSPSLFLVRDGKVHRVAIDIDVDDQRLARVKIVERTASGEVRRALTGNEEIIYSNLNELSEGEPVTSIPTDW